MKGLILAGGTGSRLYPLTRVVGKQLQPVYDKPMIYYPLTTLIENGIREICFISSPSDLPRFQQLLGDGSGWGIHLEYREQPRPEGIAQALIIAESFIGREPVALILGDNIFYGSDRLAQTFRDFESGATIFGCPVQELHRYGVVEISEDGRPLSIEEKPAHPKGRHAVPGLYLYDDQAPRFARQLKPSDRGELEITEVNRRYLAKNQLNVSILARGFAWLDAGTSSSLHDASSYVQTIEKRQGVKIGCPEEAAFRSGFLSRPQLRALVDQMPACEYRDYLDQCCQETTISRKGSV